MSAELKAAVLAAAWRDFVSWAFTEPDMIKQFEADTGHVIRTDARTGLERMIDQATGYGVGKPEIIAADFVIWATVNHWGEDEAPALMKTEIKRRRKAASPGPSWLERPPDP